LKEEEVSALFSSDLRAFMGLRGGDKGIGGLIIKFVWRDLKDKVFNRCDYKIERGF